MNTLPLTLIDAIFVIAGMEALQTVLLILLFIKKEYHNDGSENN